MFCILKVANSSHTRLKLNDVDIFDTQLTVIQSEQLVRKTIIFEKNAPKDERLLRQEKVKTCSVVLESGENLNGDKIVICLIEIFATE